MLGEMGPFWGGFAGAKRCSHEDGESSGKLIHGAGSVPPLPKPCYASSKSCFLAQGDTLIPAGGALPGAAPLIAAPDR